MKQFAFLSFLALLFCAAHAQAQTAFESAQIYAQSPSNVRNGIVRTFDDTSFVSCNLDVDSARYIFTLVSPSLPAKQLQLPKDYVVADFQLFQDQVFCCGTNKSGSCSVGFVGTFAIASFYSQGASTFTIYNLDSSICVVDKMLVYDAGGQNKCHIAALGSSMCPVTQSWFSDCLLECDYDFPTSLFTNLLGKTPHCGSPQQVPCQYLYNIIETDTNVILLSAPDPNIGQGIYLRRCNKANVTNAQSDIVYHYYTTTEPAFQGISGIAIDQFLFATASPQLDAQQWSMNVRIYKIASMDNIAVHQIPLEEKTKPAEIRYSKRLNQLYLVQHHNYTTQYNTDCDVVCFDLSQSSPYLAPILYHPFPSRYSTFTSIDLMNETALIVGSYFDAAWWYKDFSIPQGSASCYKVIKEAVKLIDPLVKGTFNEPMDPVLMTTNGGPVSIVNRTIPITIDCTH